jgi:poly-gamma-glutamate synthesis protein (capsule biosynthesis protein)
MEKTAVDKYIVLAAVGDLILADQFFYLGIGIGSQIKKGKDPFCYVKNLLRKADIVVGNLECVLSNSSISPWLRRDIMRGNPDWAHILKDAGFTHLSVANNHAFQHGYKAFEEMVDALLKVSIFPVGVRGARAVEMEIGGLKIGISAFSLRPEQYFPRWITPYAVISERELLEYCEDFATKYDIPILSVHWGDEYASLPSIHQREIAISLFEKGVKLIIGHHPHVLQPIELKGNSLVAYSLGNFVSSMCQKRARKSVILLAKIGEKGIEQAEYIPVEIRGWGFPVLIQSKTEKIINTKIYVLPEAEYVDEVRRSQIEFKSELLLWFLKNFWRYPFLSMLKIAINVLRRKAGDRW